MWFNQFRLGTWPKLFPGVQFSDQPEVLDQFFRSMTPNTGPYDANVISDSMSALFDRIGDGILFTHSQGGGPGWLHGDQEPAGEGHRVVRTRQRFVFPDGEVPPPIRNAFDTVAAEPVPMEQFNALTEDPDRHLLRRQHPQPNRRTCRRRTAGAPGCRWPGCGATR